MLINRDKPKLGELLKRIDLLNDEQIEQALSLQKKEGIKFGDAVVKLGFLKKDDINWALANQLNIPYIPDLKEKDVLDPSSVWLLPYEFAKQHCVIVLGKMLDAINIVIADPLNKAVIDHIEHITGKQINVSISDEQTILDMIETLYKDRNRIASIEQIGQHAANDNISYIKTKLNNILMDIGVGFDIDIYKNAICASFKNTAQKDVSIPLIYEGNEIGRYKIDVLLDNTVGILFSEKPINDQHIHSLLKLSKLKNLIIVKNNEKQIDLESMG